MTNYEWLKNMPQLEMAVFLNNFYEVNKKICHTTPQSECDANNSNCTICMLKWLNEEHNGQEKTRSWMG